MMTAGPAVRQAFSACRRRAGEIMSGGWDEAGALLRGPLRAAAPWPFVCRALLDDFRPRFLVKAAAGTGYRAVARNGRVLLCSDRPLGELPGCAAQVRLQTWHRAVLPGEEPQPYGVLLCVRCGARRTTEPAFVARLVTAAGPAGLLDLDVGGGQVVRFERAAP
jgi:hypothetical protein